MKKTLLSILTLVLCVLSASAKDVTFATSQLKSKAIAYPYTWETAPFEATMTVAHASKTSATISSTVSITTNSTVTVESIYPISKIVLSSGQVLLL